MPALANARHEKFAQAVATGEAAARAYRGIYKAKASTSEANASRMLRNAKVSARVAEIRGSLDAATLKGCLLTLQAKREFLAAVVRAAPGDLDEESPLVQSFKQTEGGREIRLCDKLRALELDAKLAGEFMEKVEVRPDGLTALLQSIRAGKGERTSLNIGKTA